LSNSRDPLSKVVQIMTWMLDAPGESVGVREIARGLKMPPSSVHRVLNALSDHGLVQHDSTSGRYEVGLEFFRLAWRASSSFPLRKVALPLLNELVRSCHETAFLGVYDRQRMQMMFIASVESEHPLRYVVELNRWLPVHAGASGQAIMAFLPASERRIIADARLQLVTSRTITNARRLEATLAEVRRRGYAHSRGERIQGAVGLAAPIWGPDRRVIGDVVLTVPEYRFDESGEGQLVNLLRDCAHKVTERLGGGAPPQS
jgi:IclR family acetate operon transcriptional repressor